MPDHNVFDLKQIQQQYPEAFKQTLYYGHFKVHGLYDDRQHFKIAGYCVLGFNALMLCATALLYFFNLLPSLSLAANASVSVAAALLFLWLWRAQHQAQFSSQASQRRLQGKLYGVVIWSVLLAANFCFLQSLMFVVIISLMLGLTSLTHIWVEAFFRPHVKAKQKLQLQQIRQVAWWSYRQSKKQPAQKELFSKLHQQAMRAEQRLLEQVKFSSLDEYADQLED